MPKRKPRFEKFPDYCHPLTLVISGGNKPDCDHYFPDNSKIEHDEWVEWRCAQCNASAKADVLD